MKKKKELKHALPEGILKSDLEYPSWKSKDFVEEQFELWYTSSLGWVIPTLFIRGAGRNAAPGSSHRTYAVTLDGKACRVGMGPHVLERVHVKVRKSRVDALQKYISLKNQGEVTSNEIRDRISTRRAQTAAWRMNRGY